GAGNDIERATDLARAMVTEWGMSDEFGPLNYTGSKQEVFLGRDFASSERLSEETAKRIDAEIRRLVLSQYDRAKQLLTDHQAVLEAVADALLALRAPGLVEAGAYKGEAVSATMGAMFFGKLRGCAACHQDAPGRGGQSGPELYTASSRLNADYVYSYIKRPQSFDPHVWMPDPGLVESDLQRLTGYLMQLNSGAKP
ncbi:MAG: c-type cytochrome, partial [Gammaproteobacteria bacterium]|nr:c-type cytochrome [Gammaproteobacteria bacterium]